MKNINNKQILEAINKVVVNKFIKSLKTLRTKNIKVFKCFPYTGAPDLSALVTITLFQNLEKILPQNIIGNSN